MQCDTSSASYDRFFVGPYHHGDLKNALLASARRMLERDGPSEVSFRGISRAVGVSQAAPYNHFRDKEDLLAALATVGFIELKELFRRVAADWVTRIHDARQLSPQALFAAGIRTRLPGSDGRSRA